MVLTVITKRDLRGWELEIKKLFCQVIFRFLTSTHKKQANKTRLEFVSEGCLCSCLFTRSCESDLTCRSPFAADSWSADITRGQILFTLPDRDYRTLSVTIDFLLLLTPAAVKIFVCCVNNYIFPCFGLGLYPKGLFAERKMTRSQVDRPGVRQLNAPCCSG